MTLSIEQIRRWSRQVRLPEIGLAGQEKLADARVAIVGVGGLGSPAAIYLAAAGIGTIGLIDDDVVDLTNLHRQILFDENDEGQSKVAVAAGRLRALHAGLTVNEHPLRLTAANAREILDQYDIVVDGNDNFPTRYAVNDACVLLGKPNVYGSVLRFEGRVSLFAPGHGPCYRCLYPEPPPAGSVPNCADAGVLGALPGLIGSLQASETIKWICGIGTSLVGRLLIVDLLSVKFEEIAVPQRTDCAVCGEHPTITEPVAYADDCPGGDPETDDDYDTADRITPRIAHRRRAAGEPMVILDVREPIEFEMSRLPDTMLIPLGELPSRWKKELTAHRKDEVWVLCHHGIRSAMAADFLRSQGFERVKNLEGGIERWAVEADPSIPRY
jgi:adenylyltransferase/sulfurtransferase